MRVRHCSRRRRQRVLGAARVERFRADRREAVHLSRAGPGALGIGAGSREKLGGDHPCDEERHEHDPVERLRDDEPVLCRVHSECLTGDVFGSARCDCGPQLREAVERIAETGGFLLYLRQEGRGIGLYAKLDAYEVILSKQKYLAGDVSTLKLSDDRIHTDLDI